MRPPPAAARRPDASPLRSVQDAARAVIACALAVLVAACAQAPIAPDREREARWRAEVVPALVVGDAVDVPLAGGGAFLGLHTPVAGARTAVVLVHGSGVHPDFGLVGALRMGLSDRGFTTLSIQMPVRAAGASHQEYAALMPVAAERIAAAARWLQARGAHDLVIVSHSLGARMANAYFERNAATPFRAWVSIGIVGGDYFAALSGRGIPPVLDVYGENDFPAVLRDAPARAATLRPVAGARQLRIAGADHFFAGREAQLVKAIEDFVAPR